MGKKRIWEKMIDMEQKIQSVYKREPEGNSSKETEKRTE